MRSSRTSSRLRTTLGSITLTLTAAAGGVHCTAADPAPIYDCQVDDPAAPNAHPRAAIYQALLDRATHEGIPGAVMLVRESTGGTWIGASGYADLDSRAPMRVCTRVPINSITKTFTAALVMLLIEAQRLGLDDRIADRLPPDIAASVANYPVTVRQLLTHTSGVPDYQSFPRILNDPAHAWSNQDALASIAGRPALFPPGERFSYSNTNYVLLGLIVEHLTGMSFTDMLRTRIFEPLGMTHATYGLVPPQPGATEGYGDLYGNGTLVRTTAFRHPSQTPDGGITATAGDLARFADALFHGRVVRPESLAVMEEWTPISEEDQWTPSADSGGLRLHSRFGSGLARLYSDATPPNSAVGFMGANLRAASVMFYVPQTDALVIILSNATIVPRTRPDAAFRQLLVDVLSEVGW